MLIFSLSYEHPLFERKTPCRHFHFMRTSSHNIMREGHSLLQKHRIINLQIIISAHYFDVMYKICYNILRECNYKLIRVTNYWH